MQETKRCHQMSIINAAISNLAIITVTTIVVSKLPCRQDSRNRVWFRVE